MPSSVIPSKEKAAIIRVRFLIRWVSSRALSREGPPQKENEREGTCWHPGSSEALFQRAFHHS